MKSCSACGETKPFDEFSVNKALKSGYNSACRNCIKKRSRVQYNKHREKRLAEKAEYREKHREQLKLNAREYRQRAWDVSKEWRTANRERIKETSARRRERIRQQKIGVIPMKYIERLLEKPCVYCGGKASEIDHVIPICRGGKHSIGNIVSACQSCNQKKSTKLVIEWKAIGKS